MRPYINQLIGYDARELCFTLSDLWPPERRKLHLLKHDVDKPLSVDTTVWPSLFDAGQGAGMYQKERRDAGLAEAKLPPWTGPNTGLWMSLPEMLEAIRFQFEPVTCRFWVIAITLPYECSPSSHDPPYVVGPFRANGDWRLLGYDVGDSSQLSGLSNCGLSRQEVDAVSARWVNRLNEHHLFSDPSAADSFCRSANQSVPEHAPFYVYGLWRRVVDGSD